MTIDRDLRPRSANNRALYRAVNGLIQELNGGREGQESPHSEWICECTDTKCSSRITATVAEYEAVCARPRTFIVYPGHVDTRVEYVVRGNERFTVVEKLEASTVA